MRQLFFLAVFIISSLSLAAQGGGQYGVRIDKKEEFRIKHVAKQLIATELNDLMNAIASSDLESADIDLLINQSFTENRLQVFFHKDIIIEDDVNPTFNNKVNTSDASAKKYLDDLNLLYIKSGDKSIIFSGIRESNIKQSKGSDNYIYVNVYFNSKFRNKNKEYDNEYRVNTRVAEVRMVKKDKWVPYINSILFYTPEDTVTDFADEIAIDYSSALAGTTGDSTSVIDTASVYAQIAADEERALRKAESDANEKYNEIVLKGDKAAAKLDYPTALSNYKEAKEIRPSDRDVIKKIKKIQADQAAAQLSDEKIYKDYLKQASIEEKKRNFPEAKKMLNKALDLNINDDNRPKHQARVRELDNKWLAVQELTLKYNAGHDCKALIEEYSSAIKKNKENSDLYFGRARCYDRLNDHKKAMKDYDLAFQYDNTNLPALKARAELKEKMGEPFKAIVDYENYLTSYDEDYTIYTTLSDLRMKINPNNFDEAIKDLNAGIEKNSEWAPFYYKRGLLQAQKNDQREAIKSFALALKYDAKQALTHYHMGRSHMAIGNVKNAAADFNNARNNKLDIENLANVASYAKNYYERSVRNFDANNRDSAMMLIDDAIAIDPGNSEYHFKKGYYYVYRNNNDEAIKSLSKAITFNNNFTEAHHLRGVAYSNMKKYQDAANNYITAITLDPRHYTAQKNLGDAYFAMNDYTRAAGQYEAYIATATSLKVKDPATLSVVYNFMGKSYYLQNVSDERALTAYKNAIKNDPNYAEAYYNRGLFYHKKADLPKAIADMAMANSLDKKMAEWHYQLGIAYRDKADYISAKNSFVVTMSLDSLKKFPNALYNKGNAEFILQDYPAALKTYQDVKSYKKDKGLDHFNYELGYIYMRQNMADSALVYLQHAYQRDSANAAIPFAIAVSHYLKGSTEDAFLWFEKSFATKQLKEKAIKSDSQLVALKDDKRFKTLIKKYY